MGRTEKSQGLAPPAIRKDIRAKQARNIVNKVVPAILASNTRARRGADASELIADPEPASSNDVRKADAGGDDVAYIKRKGQGRRKAKGRNDEEDAEQDGAVRKIGSRAKKSGKRMNESNDEDLSSLTLDPRLEVPRPPGRKCTVRIITTDSLTAAQVLSTTATKSVKKSSNVCILNMASPLRPGGGVLTGATSQEEFLCARTTLLPSLKESFYRLPEYGGIFTSDVLVFRSLGSLGDSAAELGAGERCYIDVISAGMLRFPDLEGEEDEVKRLAKKDREIMERKMRAVLRIAEMKGVKKLVLGAWGCGAYGNPVADVASAWSRVLSGASSSAKKSKMTVAVETWPNLGDVVFAISNPRMAADFAKAFGGGIEAEAGPRSSDADDEDDEEGHGVDKVATELRAKIEEMESQLSKVWNADLKSRLGVVLDGLKAQLRERQGVGDDSEQDGIDSDKAGAFGRTC
ncbi:uncharacterized protein EKO05_0005324 [Ascochyta rabiei]|uniref:Microbial-type PARG catalytic domain-containing protein n=1 Tax=Didymella rabiei TaxID=5454 RepID=A0A163G8R2_DIDRA|nr:uncharacterized protein EKO05_0005324 [Ascochyta rabiei]KZM24744.1 hypothetical protein ST47_g4098 [Ascochyta rabiei]UPX14853.1 hypothetical protein EKO05_0005324 [Ascochyta rabiei]